jgi:hypothetical protein
MSKLTNELVEEILKLDCRDNEQKIKLMKYIRKIKPFSNYSLDEEIPIDLLERFINKITDKYACKINYVLRSYNKEQNHWIFSLKETTGNSYIDTVYGVTISESFIKIAIRLYAAVKNGEVKERGAKKSKM